MIVEGAPKENVEVESGLLFSAASWNCFSSDVELSVLGGELSSTVANLFRSW
jgi:hypothetical protein